MNAKKISGAFFGLDEWGNLGQKYVRGTTAYGKEAVLGGVGYCSFVQYCTAVQYKMTHCNNAAPQQCCTCTINLPARGYVALQHRYVE